MKKISPTEEPEALFLRKKEERTKAISGNQLLAELSRRFLMEITRFKYSYLFTWMGRPVIQLPQDLLALQEILWEVKPELIVETGVAHGGSLIFHASMLELLGGNRQVIGVEKELRPHNRQAIQAHPMSKRIVILEGSSTENAVVEQVRNRAKGKRPVMVVLDSNHTHAHVLKELELYSPLVTTGSYLIVFDTVIEDLPDDFFPDRPWGKGNNPKTAVLEFLKKNDGFRIDKKLESKLLLTSAPDGYLKRVREERRG